jgi:hypothetical protein
MQLTHFTFSVRKGNEATVAPLVGSGGDWSQAVGFGVGALGRNVTLVAAKTSPRFIYL